MDNFSCIFWFSGTGNSLYAAKKLSEGLGDMPLIHINSETIPGSIGGVGAKVGFVFPSYFCNLPRLVRGFIDKLDIEPDTYLFAVVTMGGLGQGTVGALDKLLKSKGLRLNFGRGLAMPANYVLKYNPADSCGSETKLDKKDELIAGLAAQISAETQSVKTFPVTLYNLYRNIEKLDAGFSAGDKCTDCQRCRRVCPVENIRMENGKPVWLHHCEHCMACISWCPTKAIEYGEITRTRRRYHNPRIKFEELCGKN